MSRTGFSLSGLNLVAAAEVKNDSRKLVLLESAQSKIQFLPRPWGVWI
jgi:hypothetical protein